MAQQLFFGKLQQATVSKTNFIIFQGDVSTGSPIVNNISSGTSQFKVGQFLTDPSGAFPSTAIIISVDSSTQITVDQNSTQTLSTQNFGLNTPEDVYHVSGTLVDPNQKIDANDITGSEDPGFLGSEWAILGPSSDENGTPLTGIFHSYNITSVISRTGQYEFEFFAEFADSGSEGAANQYLNTNTVDLGITRRSNIHGLLPAVSKETTGLQTLPNGIEAASYNITAPDYFDTIPSNGDGSLWYDGSTYLSSSKDVRITGSLQVKGSTEITTEVGGTDFFIIKSGSEENLKFNGEGIAQFFAFDNAHVPSPILGGLYFTSESIFVGLE